MDVAKNVFSEKTEDYVKEVPFQIKKIAVKDCYTAWRINCKKTKETKIPFELSFRKRKDPRQSCYIPKQAIKESGIYYTMSGKLKYAERDWFENEIGDCRLMKEFDRWYIVVPMRFERKTVTENQGDVVAIDPGIRAFLSYFSSCGHFGQLGVHSFERILRLNLRIDKLTSMKELETDRKHRQRIYRSIGKVRNKLHDLVDELHWKCINFFVSNFRVVVFPPFKVSEMVEKENRKIRKSVVRSMLSFRFYEFKERLKQKCAEHGVLFIEQCEAYTSKTNSFNGELMNIGSKETFKYDGITVNRDINGARNILLRAMRDSSVLAEMPITPNTIATLW